MRANPRRRDPFHALSCCRSASYASDPETDYLAFASPTPSRFAPASNPLGRRSTLAAERFVGEALDLRSLADEVPGSTPPSPARLSALGDHSAHVAVVAAARRTGAGIVPEQVSLRDLTTFEKPWRAGFVAEPTAAALRSATASPGSRRGCQSDALPRYYLRGTRQAHEYATGTSHATSSACASISPELRSA